LRDAARRPASRDVDVVLFTSSIQLDHILRVAAEQGIETEVRASLAQHAVVASVRPIMTASLEAAGLAVDIG
jgi:uroporphyrinogen-III synthase